MTELHFISGELEGLRFLKHYLCESVDGYVWTQNYADRKLFTFDEACNIFDEIFLAGRFRGVIGTIEEDKTLSG